jgi:hypothetical protein
MSVWTDLFPSSSGNSLWPSLPSGALMQIGASGGADLGYNRDYFFFFAPKRTFTFDELMYYHGSSTSAHNTYIGVYDIDGNLLTDCAVDTDTTANTWHAISTTPVTLVEGNVYVTCANTDIMDVLIRSQTWSYTQNYGAHHYVPVFPGLTEGMLTRYVGEKTRTNAALPSTYDFSTLSNGSYGAFMGFVVA